MQRREADRGWRKFLFPPKPLLPVYLRKSDWHGIGQVVFWHPPFRKVFALPQPLEQEEDTSGRGRTDTPLREQDFESSASANFATLAFTFIPLCLSNLHDRNEIVFAVCATFYTPVTPPNRVQREAPSIARTTGKALPWSLTRASGKWSVCPSAAGGTTRNSGSSWRMAPPLPDGCPWRQATLMKPKGSLNASAPKAGTTSCRNAGTGQPARISPGRT